MRIIPNIAKQRVNVICLSQGTKVTKKLILPNAPLCPSCLVSPSTSSFEDRHCATVSEIVYNGFLRGSTPTLIGRIVNQLELAKSIATNIKKRLETILRRLGLSFFVPINIL